LAGALEGALALAFEAGGRGVGAGAGASALVGSSIVFITVEI
jgi:hypothetical protein